MDGSIGARIQALTAFGDDGMQLLALEELNQMLSMGQQGEFRVSAYVPALIKVAERASNNTQLVLMAIRALTQIFDLEPRAGALAISEGVLPIVCSRLLSMSDLDLAEQCVKCLNILVLHHARDVLHAGGLKAITAFFDFFPQHLQRKVVETAELLCADAGRQVEDAYHILEACQSLSICLDSPDEKVWNTTCGCFSKLLSSYGTSASSSSTGSSSFSRHRAGQPTLESVRTLQNLISHSKAKDISLDYYNMDLSPYMPKYSPNWRKQTLSLIGGEKVVRNIVSLCKRRIIGDEGAPLLTALARLVRVLPHTVIFLVRNGIFDILKSKLSASGSSTSSESLTCALRLIQAMLPPVPHSKSFDLSQNGELCFPEEYDASLVLSDLELQAAEERRQQMQEKIRSLEGAGEQTDSGDGDVTMEADMPTEDFWACTLCTFHNPVGASTCEMCGQVSPQISQRASRLEETKGQADGSGASDDPEECLQEILLKADEQDLGITSSSQLYREMPELLEAIVTELMPDLTQVAAKSANPDHRTRALAILSSVLYCAPRPLLKRIGELYGPGGEHHVGVVYAGLQSQNAHVVGSALRVAIIELWRTGISPSLHREGIPQLVRGLGSRFPEPHGNSNGETERVMAVRRRAATWLSHYEKLLDDEDESSCNIVPISASGPTSLLKSIGERLLAVENSEVEQLIPGLERKVNISPRVLSPGFEDSVDTPPSKKPRRMGTLSPVPSPLLHEIAKPVGKNVYDEYVVILSDLASLLGKGVVASEFQASGLSPIMAALSHSSAEFIRAFGAVFSDVSSAKWLIRTLHDAIDGAERYAVIKHGISSSSASEVARLTAILARVVVVPTEATHHKLQKVLSSLVPQGEAITEEMLSFPIKADPLARACDLESMIWSNLKAKVAELRNTGKSTESDERSSSKRSAAAALGLFGSMTSDEDENRYAQLQAGDPVHIVDILRPGTRVVRGRDWKWGDQDGGPGRTGIVTDVRPWNGHPDSCIRVRWDVNKGTNVYRYNVENAFDLALAPRVPSRPIPQSGKASGTLVANNILEVIPESFQKQLKRGDAIDALDTFHRWYHAVVRVVVPGKDDRVGAVRVAFDGFGPRFDEWIPLSSKRIAPFNSRVRETGFAVGEVDDSAIEYLTADATAFHLPTSVLLGRHLTSASPNEGAKIETENADVSEDKDVPKDLPLHTRLRWGEPPSAVTLRAGMPIRVKRVDEEKMWDAIILQLGERKSPQKDSATPEATNEKNTENEVESKLDEPDYLMEVEHTGDEHVERAVNGEVGTYFVQLRPITRVQHDELTGDDDQEEEDDDENDEDDSMAGNWIDVAELVFEPLSERSGDVDSGSTAEKPSAGFTSSLTPGSKCFATVCVLDREVYIPVVVQDVTDKSLGEDEQRFVVQSNFGGSIPSISFAVSSTMLKSSPPRGGFVASLKELRSLAKAIYELDDLVSEPGKTSFRRSRSNRGRIDEEMSSTGDSSRFVEPAQHLLSQAEEKLSHLAKSGPGEFEDDFGDAEDTTSRSPVPVTAAVVKEESPTSDKQLQQQKKQEKAKALFATARLRSLVREYSGVDMSSELSSSSVHRSLSAAAASSARIVLNAVADESSSSEGPSHRDVGVPVLLCARRDPNDTIHQCIARYTALEEAVKGSGGGITCLDYWLDFSHPEVEVLRQALARGHDMIGLGENDILEEVCGLATVSGASVYTGVTSFPTLAFRDVALCDPETKWYWEVDIVSPGLAQVGVMDTEAVCDDGSGRGCGDDSHGWAFDGKRRVKWHGDSSEWGSYWREGDVLGIAVSIHQSTCDITFSLNGSFQSPMGVAFENVPFNGALRPAVTFNKTFGFKVRPDNFQFSPPDSTFQPLRNAIQTAETENEDPEVPALDESLLAPEPEQSELFTSIFDQGEALPPAAHILRLVADLQLCRSDALVNRRLTNKLVWQMQDSLAVCSGALPYWCFRTVREFPFLFPLETRQLLFSLTAFGVSRSILGILGDPDQDASSTRASSRSLSDSTPMPRPKRQKVALPRKRVLEAGILLMKRFSRSRSIITVEFAEEIGHGLGPTLEFYALVCRELQRDDLGLWRKEGHIATLSSLHRVETQDDSEVGVNAAKVANGLYPAVLPDSTEEGTRLRVLELFRFLGRLIGRALLDDRLLDFDFSELFLEQLLYSTEKETFQTLDTAELLEQMRLVDPDFTRSLQYFHSLGLEYASLNGDDKAVHVRREELESIVSSLSLEAVLPGAEDVRAPGLDGSVVTAASLLDYVRSIGLLVCHEGIHAQIMACRDGLKETIDPNHLKAFTATELRARLGGAQDKRPWMEQEISQNMVLRDYARDSPSIVHLLQVLCELSPEDRRLFLRFLTGSPRLPVGGWAALRPKLTVVRKTGDDPDTLPSCSTCAVMLKLPQYSSKEQLREKLMLAIREGQSYFSMD